MILFFNLNVKDTFDNVLYFRFLHNMRKKKFQINY